MDLCPGCSTPQDEGSAYCHKCGYHFPTPINSTASQAGIQTAAAITVLPGICSACGYKNIPGVTFCEKCGVQLAPYRSLPPPKPRLNLPGKDTIPATPPEEEYFVQSDAMAELVITGCNQRITVPNRCVQIIIGRSDPIRNIYPMIDLTPYGGEIAGVSREHARLIIQGENIFIEDLFSTNFTTINNCLLRPGSLYLLNSGDEITIGKLKVLFYKLI